MNFREPLILAYRNGASALAHVRPGQWLLALLLAGGAVAAFGLVPDDEPMPVPATTIERALDLPRFEAAPSSVYWHEERVKPGDTIGALLARAGVDDAAAFQFLRADPSARPLYQLRPGRVLRIASNDDDQLTELRFMQPSGQMLTVMRDGDGFAAHSALPVYERRVDMRSGEIRSSLFAAADAVDMPDAVTLALAEVFGGDIDFHHDLQRGDRFTVVYESRFIDGEPAGAGRILAAEFVHKGATLRAYEWTDADGNAGYYGEDGRSLRRAFLRAPLAFSRITSGFTRARLHPILNTWRAHRGTDFAAPIGTPVHVTGDGVVAVAGRQNGYGNVIIIRHGNTYSTVYAHLSRFAAGLHAGEHVGQGDVIGFVGMTGWATGPHLHYEFRIDDVPRDSVTVALPNAQPVRDGDRAKFAADVAARIDLLALARNVSGVALAAQR